MARPSPRPRSASSRCETCPSLDIPLSVGRMRTSAARWARPWNRGGCRLPIRRHVARSQVRSRIVHLDAAAAADSVAKLEQRCVKACPALRASNCHGHNPHRDILSRWPNHASLSRALFPSPTGRLTERREHVILSPCCLLALPLLWAGFVVAGRTRWHGDYVDRWWL